MIYILTFIILSARIDFEHLRDNDYIESHVSRWLLRALFIVVASDSIVEVFGMSLVFAALFDQVLNLMMGKPLFYLGSTAVWDRFWNDKKWLYITFKVVALIIGCLLCWKI
jgi:hypothetical protein